MTSIKPARFINKPEITAIADRLLVEIGMLIGLSHGLS
jgi:hypothetical protein